MADQDRESIVERVRKLRAQAESATAIGSEHEAQAFAALMQRMMVEHKVREDELAVAERRPEKIVELWWDGVASNDPSRPEGGRHPNRIEWVEALAGVVASAHYCRIMVRTGEKFWLDRLERDELLTAEQRERYERWGTASVCMVGRESDASAAIATFEVMVKLAASLGRVAYFEAYQAFRKGEGSWQRGFYRSYLLGFASRLRERYEAELGAIDAELRQLGKAETKLIGGEAPAAAQRQCSALVRIAKETMDQVDAHFELKRSKGELGTARHVGVGAGNRDAFGKGRAAADKIKLRADQRLDGSRTKGLLS